MNSQCNPCRLSRVVGALRVSSCAWVPSYVSDPGVMIDKVSTSSGRVTSASFWANKQAYELCGEITPQPMSNGPIGGRVDIAITAPDETSAECTTIRQQNRVRYARKPFSIQFEQLPAPGRVVQVEHHDSANHEGCVG